MSALALHCALHTIADDAGFIAAPLLEVMRGHGCDDCEAFARVLTRSGRIGRADKRARQIMPGLVTELCSLGYLALSLDAGREGAELRSLDNKQPLRWDETEGRKRTREKRTPSPGVVAGDLPLADATTTSDASRASFVGTPEGRQRDTRGTPEGQDTIATPRNHSSASVQKRGEEKRKRGEDARTRTREAGDEHDSPATEPDHAPETIQPKRRATSDEGSFVAAFARGAGSAWLREGDRKRGQWLNDELRNAVGDERSCEDLGEFAAWYLSKRNVSDRRPKEPTAVLSVDWFVFVSGGECESRRLSLLLKAWRELGESDAAYRKAHALFVAEHEQLRDHFKAHVETIKNAARRQWVEITAARAAGDRVIANASNEDEHVRATVGNCAPLPLSHDAERYRSAAKVEELRAQNAARRALVDRIVAGEPLPVVRFGRAQHRVASPEYARESIERMHADRDERERERLREEDAQRTAAMASRGPTLAEQWQNYGAHLAAQQAAKAAKAATAAPVETDHGGGGGDDPCDDERPDWGDLDSIENQANDRCDGATETDDEREPAPSTGATHEARSPNPVARLEAKLVSLEINKTDTSAERLPIAPPAKVAR